MTNNKIEIYKLDPCISMFCVQTSTSTFLPIFSHYNQFKVIFILYVRIHYSVEHNDYTSINLNCNYNQSDNKNLTPLKT